MDLDIIKSMPAFFELQWSWMPEDWKNNLKATPWFKPYKNAYDWCIMNMTG